MIPNLTTERSVLEARVSELERRLAWLERQLGEQGPEPALAVPPPEIDVSPVGEGDPRGGSGGLEDPDGGLEGARLVAIELLSSGYGRDEVATYLRSTFGIADAESVIAGASPVPG